MDEQSRSTDINIGESENVDIVSLSNDQHPTKCPVCGDVFPSFCDHLENDPDCSRSLLPAPSAFLVPPRSDAPRIGRYHRDSGYLYDVGDPNTLERMKLHKYEPQRKENPYFPFSDEDDWELAKFLYRNFNQTQINDFLRLQWVNSGDRKPSFRNYQELLSFLDTIPKGPAWQRTEIRTEGYATKEPVYLYWRDALEVVRDIFGNPVFAQHMMYDPYHIYEGAEREYGEWMSGDEAHRIQDELPEGATIVPIVLASGKAPVTGMTGDIEMHPVFLTIANINSEVRMKETSHAWACIAYIPIPEFLTHSDFYSILESRMWHSCMDIICASLKDASHRGVFLADPSNCTRYCFTPLVAYVAGLPEQQVIACVSRSASPITTAVQNQFGDGVRHPPRDGQLTLERLRRVRSATGKGIHPWLIQEFQAAATQHHLSGVHLPFWRNWRFSNPATFLVGEIFPFCHKFLFDHILNWCKRALGEDELDARYRCQHMFDGTRHFTGVSQAKQMTGREHRDIQRTIVATIAGGADPDFVRAVRAIVDFIYRAQAPTFTPSSIEEMEACLSEFHRYKQAIIQAGVQTRSGDIPHFQIPKLELLQSFGHSVPNVGSLIQYTVDVSDLITHCKNPFLRANHQRAGFTQQIIQFLHYEECLRRFDLYALLRGNDAPLTNIISMEYYNGLCHADPIAPDDVYSFDGSPTPHDPLQGFVSDDVTTTLHVTKKLDFADKPMSYVSTTYALPDFISLFVSYIDNVAGHNSAFHSYPLRGWLKFRIQTQSQFRPFTVLPSQQVQALPPSNEYPRGKCDTVLAHVTTASGPTVLVAQVRAVFSLSTRGFPLPPELASPLLYVQLFAFTASPSEQPEVGMYTVRRMFRTNCTDNCDDNRCRVGAIIPITDVIQTVELIPKYGLSASRDATSKTSLELYDEFYLNSFFSKEFYYTVHDGL